jgi:Ser-tRNA(Ala) deacylase AlaX
MTERLYSTEQYLRATLATVVDVDRDGGLVLLDRTVVYPGGGGQPPDSGVLRLGSGGSEDVLRIVDARADDRGVFVLLDRACPSRILASLPEGVEPRRVTLAEAVAQTRDLLQG